MAPRSSGTSRAPACSTAASCAFNPSRIAFAPATDMVHPRVSRASGQSQRPATRRSKFLASGCLKLELGGDGKMVGRAPYRRPGRDDIAADELRFESLGYEHVVEANVRIRRRKRQSSVGRMQVAIAVDLSGAQHDGDRLPANAA